MDWLLFFRYAILYTLLFEWNGIAQEPYVFVGFENYITFFNDYQTATAFKKCIYAGWYRMCRNNTDCIFLATVINKKFHGLRLLRLFYFMPVVINRIAISLMFIFILYPKMGPFTVLMQQFDWIM